MGKKNIFGNRLSDGCIDRGISDFFATGKKSTGKNFLFIFFVLFFFVISGCVASLAPEHSNGKTGHKEVGLSGKIPGTFVAKGKIPDNKGEVSAVKKRISGGKIQIVESKSGRTGIKAAMTGNEVKTAQNKKLMLQSKEKSFVFDGKTSIDGQTVAGVAAIGKVVNSSLKARPPHYGAVNPVNQNRTFADKVSGLPLKPVGGTLANLSGYRPVQIVSTHVPFAKKYKKDKKKHHVELAFDNADIYEVLDATLFGIYGVNYIVDPHITAKVTFHFSGDYSKNEFVELLNNVLQMDNLAIVKGPGDMFKVVMKNASASFGNIQAQTSSSVSNAGDITRVFRLRYLSAAAASQTVRGFLSRGAAVLVENVSNSIVVTDSRANIGKVARILALMDIPYFKNIHWLLIPLKEVQASELYRDISRILRAGGLFNRAGVDRGSYVIVPIKSLNALLVVSKWPEIISLVKKWADIMDHNDIGTGTNVFVYFVQNGKAEDLANVLKELYGGKKTSRSQRVKIVKPGIKSKTGRTSTKTIVSGELSGNVEIIPDEINNAIVVKANARDYRLIKSVLKQLDIVPRQVLINVVVAEITLTKKTEYGLQWFFSNNIGKYKAVTMLDKEKSTLTSETKLGDLSGFRYGIFNSTNVLRTLVKALGNNSDVNILSSPNVLAVNNKEADIEVSEDVPTITGSVTDSTGGGVTNTVQYKKTGIILKVTPHINSRGLVKLDLEQEVSAPGEYDARLNNFSFLTRKATTSAVVEDGQTMILGGMMKTNNTNSEVGIPLLQDIPVVGNLFKTTTKNRTKTELIFLITTNVIYNRADADRITAEFSKKIAGVKKLIESSKK